MRRESAIHQVTILEFMVARALRIGAGIPVPVAPVAAVFPFSTGSWSLARYVEPSPGSGQDSRQRRL